MSTSFPLDICFVQFLIPCRNVSGKGCEMLLYQSEGLGVNEFNLLAVSPTNTLWDGIKRDPEADKYPELYRILRGLVTDALGVHLQERTHDIIGTTEPFLYMPTRDRGKGPHIAVGYVFRYDLANPPENFRWVSFNEVSHGEGSVIKLYGPSKDPQGFNNMLAVGMEMFIKQVC